MIIKVKNDHRSKFSNKQLERRSLKKIRASTGFEPMTSALPVRCSTNWAMKPHIGSEVNLLSSYLPWGVKWSEVYEIISNCLNWKNLLRWSFFTFIYIRSSKMNYWQYCHGATYYQGFITKKISYKQTSELEINYQVQLLLMNASCGHILLKILFHLFILLWHV